MKSSRYHRHHLSDLRLVSPKLTLVATSVLPKISFRTEQQYHGHSRIPPSPHIAHGRRCCSLAAPIAAKKLILLMRSPLVHPCASRITRWHITLCKDATIVLAVSTSHTCCYILTNCQMKLAQLVVVSNYLCHCLPSWVLAKTRTCHTRSSGRPLRVHVCRWKHPPTITLRDQSGAQNHQVT